MLRGSIPPIGLPVSKLSHLLILLNKHDSDAFPIYTKV